MVVHLGAPQWIVVGLFVLNLMISAWQHGKPERPSNVLLSVVGVGIMILLLVWGGFFGR